jgi:hypothetical protein
VAGEGTPLFCPFCRECFEGETRCPEHELPLVPIDALPPDPREARELPDDDEELPLHEWRYGRGIAFGGAVLLAAGFFLPFVSARRGAASVTDAAYEAAVEAPALWTIPLVMLAVLFVLFRRRTPRQLRGARLAIPVLALLVPASMAWTLFKVFKLSSAQQMVVSVEPGAYVLGVASALVLLGGLRLGVTPEGDAVPHGARAEEGESRIVVDDRDDGS